LLLQQSKKAKWELTTGEVIRGVRENLPLPKIYRTIYEKASRDL
jgi:hypothetical protein